MPSSRELYETYKTTFQEIADIKYASAVLQWDQETYLPPKGGDARGRQIASLNELAHKLFTNESTGKILYELMSRDDLGSREKRNVELSLEDFEKNKKLPSSFVRKMSEVVNKSFHAWIKARKENSFTLFQEPLDELVNLKIQEADLLGYSGHPYDALMNDYDKGLTVEFTDKLFNQLIPPLSELLEKIRQKPQVDNSFLFQHFDKDTQWKYGIELLKQLHYDFEAGRQDISEHPFTTNFSSRDVRITTRIDERDFSNMTWSCMHECGHALYEQGLPYDEYGLPLGEYCSLSIHESQSRLWENAVGRSREFWTYQYPFLKQYFPQQLKDISTEQFYAGINKVEPSLIRTEADELTYHFHVYIRYNIEKQLIEKSISTKDLSEIWNNYYKQLLGVDVPDDKNGCLQDVHWSHGSFGYFATYSIGSLYAAQLFSAIKKSIPSVNQMMSTGSTSEVFQWLQQHIYPFGRYYNSSDLCRKATGEILDANHFLGHASEKYKEIYKI
jgi:carboxypeptidase Taq